MSTSEDDEIVAEILKIHKNNELENFNRTLNAFMIYRHCFYFALQNYKLSRNVISKLASESWKIEPYEIKDRYKRMAENVRKEFKKEVPILFILCNLAR